MMAHARNLTRRDVAMQIDQMRPQILQRLALREIIRELIKMPEPGIAVLPVSESERLHSRHATAPKSERKPRSLLPSGVVGVVGVPEFGDWARALGAFAGAGVGCDALHGRVLAATTLYLRATRALSQPQLILFSYSHA